MWIDIIVVMLTPLVVRTLIDPIFYLLNSKGIYKKNFENRIIPTSMGMIFIIVLSSVNSLLAYKYKSLWGVYIFLGILGFGVLGLIDDFLGDGEFRGFKGHIKAAFKKKITTGMIKAVGGLLVSINIVWMSSEGNIIEDFIAMLLLLMSTNFINLLDVRPGRASKGFITLIILSILLSKETYILTFDWACLAMVVFYIDGDLHGKYMMGDVGANVLGFITGISFLSISNFYIKLFLAVLFTLLNLLSEKISFNKIIERNVILCKIDKAFSKK